MADLLERPVVIGASGQLGTELMHVLRDRNVVGLDHAALEIQDAAAVDATLAHIKPTLVINTAAFHNVEECEREPQRTLAINAIAVDHLAALCARHGAAFATMSSDYVFDGAKKAPYEESDEPRPLNVYGVSKRTAELFVQRHGTRYFIFRTSGMYGIRTSTQKGHTFVDRLLRQVDAGETPRIVTDIVSSPSYAPDVANGMRAVIEREAYGIVHVTNAGSCSWYDFANEALKLAGKSGVQVAAASYKDFPSTAPRPSYSVLAHEALAALSIPMPMWQDALKRYLAQRAAAG